MSDKAKVQSPSLWKEFDTPESANNLLKLSAIHRFSSTAEAVEDATALTEGKMSKNLKKFLTDEISGKTKSKNEELVVVDPKLGGSISKKLGIQVVSDSSVLDLYRGIRQHLASLLSAGSKDSSNDGSLDPRDLNTMSLGLSHSLSRYKLKFSPDKVDTMVVQAIGLLDDLDKEINIYAMRVKVSVILSLRFRIDDAKLTIPCFLKEWYGWHFPEMGKIINDNLAYAKVARVMGFRTNAQTTDFSEVLPEEIEETLKAAAEISMGTEISDTDIQHIWSLCDQVISISSYRAQLYAYLQNRMAAIAPNLTALVGELVGARLISHAGSLMNLAKHPASTVQILGAEKALFRALKTKHDTPKYGLIFHSSLVGQAPAKLKGKMARMVATKAALSIRLDALTDADSKSDLSAPTIGLEARAKLESRLRALEHRSDIGGLRAAKGPDAGYKQKPFEFNAARSYNTAADAPPPADPMQVDTSVPAAADSSKKLSKEERKALKQAVKGDESSTMSKEERKALKKANKAAAVGEISTNGDVTVNGDAKKEKKEKKRKESESGTEVEALTNGINGDEPAKKKKKKKHVEA